MPKYRPAATYIHSRRGYWYFRYRLPNEIRSAASVHEIRLSLNTRNRQVALARASVGLIYIYAITRMAQGVNRLTDQARQNIVRNKCTLSSGETRTHPR